MGDTKVIDMMVATLTDPFGVGHMGITAENLASKGYVVAAIDHTDSTYDDKVAIIRMIVSDEAGRVSNVFKQMMKKDLDLVG